MLQQRNKKIIVYISLFFIIGTINNKSLNNLSLPKIKEIQISGLSNEKNMEVSQKLESLKLNNLFILKKFQVTQLLNSFNYIEDLSIFKKYPSSLNIKLIETNYLAVINKNENKFFLGSNGKMIRFDSTKKKLPHIFGNFNKDEFFRLKEIIENTDFDYNKIKNLFFFPSGRWDIEINSNQLIKLPKNELKKSFDLFLSLIENENFKNAKIIDLRQLNQIIIND
tara:strand:+ start:1160 stop:1831 length:672 start_codon:yes stop_codon:yes gene_type:complete